MRQEVIIADNIDGAVQNILRFLEDTNEKHGIYFDGWQGFGASAVLRSVAEHLISAKNTSPKLKFHKIIHIDCSKWKSRRAMQRIIAEQLVILEAINILDTQDDEDDFNGIDEGSRAETKDAARAISSFLMDKRFLVAFHNGSDYEINITDMTKFGMPFYIQNNVNKMLWTFRGRFRLSAKVKEIVQTADVFLHSQLPNQGLNNKNFWWSLLHEESKEVALYCSVFGFNLDPAMVSNCWLYVSKLNCIGSHIIDFDWSIHASSYWICDGIINCDNSEAWKLADILHQEMRHEWDDPGLFYLMGSNDKWVSTTYFDSSNDGSIAVPVVPQTVSSLFLAAQRLDSDERHLEYFGFLKYERTSFLHDYNHIFRHTENLRVLKLSHCSFKFDSPPFQCCQNLRFLGLDYCQDLGVSDEKDVQSWTILTLLWVLDICYTQWILTQEMIHRMVNLRELNVKGANPWTISHIQNWPQNLYKLRVIKANSVKDNSFSLSNMDKIELLNLSGNTTMKSFPDLSNAINLKTVIVDGCVALESVSAGSLPTSLETFSLDCPMDDAKISKISLRSCPRLMHVRLKGLPRLEDLDLSGTSVKTVDLSIMQSPVLKRLFLLGCHWLRAILWSDDGEPKLEELLINTSPHQNGGDDKLFQSHIVIDDARLLRSLGLFIRRMRHLNLHISSTNANCSNQKGIHTKTNIGKHIFCEQPTNGNVAREAVVNKYNDIFKIVGAVNVSLVMWPCPQLPPPPKHQGSCKMEIMSSSKLQGVENTLAYFIDIADTLFVHDDFWISSIPGSNWGWLKWCCIERCPRLHSVFTFGEYDEVIAFSLLEIFWASHLPVAQYIWSKGFYHIHADSFKRLHHIHLESCPELIHVLPLSVGLPSLETIEILYCSSLTKIFPLITTYHKEIVKNGSAINFPMLKRIHLHELPNLEQICASKIMSTPLLNTIKIRGCWNLRRLPAIPGGHGRPMVDCEKDWWDNLEWDGLGACHHPLSYDRHHSHYYKKLLCKRSVLR